VTFLDADNLWPPGILPIMVDRLLENGGCDIVRGVGQSMKVDAGVLLDEGVGSAAASDLLATAIYWRMMIETVGLFDPESWFGEDSGWFDRAREKGFKLRQLNQVTLLIRRHDATLSRGIFLHEMNTLKTLKRVLDRERAENRRWPI